MAGWQDDPILKRDRLDALARYLDRDVFETGRPPDLKECRVMLLLGIGIVLGHLLVLALVSMLGYLVIDCVIEIGLLFGFLDRTDAGAWVIPALLGLRPAMPFIIWMLLLGDALIAGWVFLARLRASSAEEDPETHLKEVRLTFGARVRRMLHLFPEAAVRLIWYGLHPEKAVRSSPLARPAAAILMLLASGERFVRDAPWASRLAAFGAACTEHEAKDVMNLLKKQLLIREKASLDRAGREVTDFIPDTASDPVMLKFELKKNHSGS
ncbi:MAG TPA: hypothetical protein PKM25_07850 [Candidatus Ozemobacteraceae bacterium]|nr:hypothetical protein [Candidatus Ozemobacteraceae bacterium]